MNNIVKGNKIHAIRINLKNHYQLYLLVIIPLIWVLIFRYWPMYGSVIAFKNFKASKGILGSEWVGFKYFIKFFSSFQFTRILFNTVGLSLYQLLAGFPMPIILALALNATLNERFKKTVQFVTYAPHFISVVALCGMVMQFLSPRTGMINELIALLGGEKINFIGIPVYFKSIYVWSGVWQQVGWGSIVYLAALAGIDESLHEAAVIDGANRFKRVVYIDIPGILPTVITLLIINMGQIMTIGFEKVFLLQNQLNISSSEIISTYVYKVGLASGAPNFSYATAIGLFNSVVNLLLILSVNSISKRVSNTSLW